MEADQVEEDEPKPPIQERLLSAFRDLQKCVSSVAPHKTKNMADVFLAFDEAHSLAEFWDDGSRLSNYNYFEFRRALLILNRDSLFTFFLSTTGKISQFMPPRSLDPSSRIADGPLKPPHAFIELGFDQLMLGRKVLDAYRTLEQVTSLECVAHMGRPL
jgi:hypothetical protein